MTQVNLDKLNISEHLFSTLIFILTVNCSNALTFCFREVVLFSHDNKMQTKIPEYPIKSTAFPIISTKISILWSVLFYRYYYLI
jgi:hypothetical protein